MNELTLRAHGWATPYIEKLRRGETVQFRPRGNSMAGKIDPDNCALWCRHAAELSVATSYCASKRLQYLHLIKAIQGKRIQIGTIVPHHG